MITPRSSFVLAFSLLLACALDLTAQADSRPTSKAGHNAAARKPKHDLRLRLRELLDRVDPPATVELDGRIHEVKKLQKQARELWQDGENFTDEQLGAATVEALMLRLLQEKLTASRRYLSEKAFKEVRKQHQAEYDGTFFNLKTMATRLKGYPAVDSYWAWYRLKVSFGQSIEKDLTTERLKKFLPEVEGFLALDQIQVRAMFFSARGDEKKHWDFDQAYRHAMAARARLAKGEDFAKVARKGDPLPVGEPRSRMLNYNLLRRAYGDTEYGELFAGGSAFHAAFFGTRQGQCTAPVPGRGGYWILKVEKRSPTGRKVGTNEDLLRKMYVHDRFQKWVTATLGKVVLKVKPR